MPGKFILIGSGLAGGLLAAYLGRHGYEVELYERRGDPREGNIVGGRSINLALSTRGIYALEQLGIADEVLRHAIPMRGRIGPLGRWLVVGSKLTQYPEAMSHASPTASISGDGFNQ